MQLHRFIAALILLALFASPAPAAFVDYEPFDYAGTTLNDQSGGAGFSGPWFATGPSPTIQLSNDNTSLNYPASYEPPFTAPTPVGDRVFHTGDTTNNASSSRLLSEPINMGAAGNVLYASALIQKNSTAATTNDSILFEFVDANANRRFGFGIEAAEGFWINANASNQVGTAVQGQTYFLVAKLVTDDDATPGDVASLKIFGPGWATEVPTAEPTTWDVSVSTNSAAILDRVRLRIDRNQINASVDELRIADSWQAVTAPVVPEPTSLAFVLFATTLAFRRRRP